MAFFGILALLVFVGAIVWPQFWVKRVMARHNVVREDFPGTGGEFAQHLIERFELLDVGVEETEGGDHYDPESKTVRLSKTHFYEATLTGVAVAAHEVGHALQDANNERSFRLRNGLVSIARVTDRFASVFFIAAPLFGVFLQSPRAGFIFVAIGIGFLAMRVLVHLITLPVEYDASFGKALPILEEGGYLSGEDMPAARSVLKAAAFTYVAGALMGMIDLARWIRMIR